MSFLGCFSTQKIKKIQFQKSKIFRQGNTQLAWGGRELGHWHGSKPKLAEPKAAFILEISKITIIQHR